MLTRVFMTSSRLVLDFQELIQRTEAETPVR
jgi:hypothetical protein